MRYILLFAKLLIYGYLGYLLFVLAVEYDPANPAFRPPFALFALDWVNLFIHEAGHFFFRIFGQFLHLLGGSLTQVLLPAALAIVSWRQAPRTLGLPLFWTGESLVNASVYIRDAPYQQLHLIGKGLLHDWNRLLHGDPDLAQLLADGVFGLGLLCCLAAVGAGIWFAIVTFREAALLDQPPQASVQGRTRGPGRKSQADEPVQWLN